MAKRFIKGHGVYKCTSCDRMTRGDDDSVWLKMCTECNELAGCDNLHNDTATNPNEEELAFYNRLADSIVNKGGRKDIRDDFPYLFT